jgi:NADH dehydrogenase/NADH:ubiquinone oxidoreductase subunit G
MTKKIKFTLNGFEIATKTGRTVLEAALENDVYIPHLCHHPDLIPVGVCRLCGVEIEGRGLVMSCCNISGYNATKSRPRVTNRKPSWRLSFMF